MYDILYVNYAGGHSGVDLSDFIAKSGLKVSKEWLVKNSGRNAEGTMMFDKVAPKYKITVTLRPMTPEVAASILGPLVDNYTDLEVHFLNPYTNSMTQINAYIGSQAIQYMTLALGIKQTSPFTLSFIEL